MHLDFVKNLFRKYFTKIVLATLLLTWHISITLAACLDTRSIERYYDPHNTYMEFTAQSHNFHIYEYIYLLYDMLLRGVWCYFLCFFFIILAPQFVCFVRKKYGTTQRALNCTTGLTCWLFSSTYLFCP